MVLSSWQKRSSFICLLQQKAVQALFPQDNMAKVTRGLLKKYRGYHKHKSIGVSFWASAKNLKQNVWDNAWLFSACHIFDSEILRALPPEWRCFRFWYHHFWDFFYSLKRRLRRSGVSVCWLLMMIKMPLWSLPPRGRCRGTKPRVDFIAIDEVPWRMRASEPVLPQIVRY